MERGRVELTRGGPLGHKELWHFILSRIFVTYAQQSNPLVRYGMQNGDIFLLAFLLHLLTRKLLQRTLPLINDLVA